SGEVRHAARGARTLPGAKTAGPTSPRPPRRSPPQRSQPRRPVPPPPEIASVRPLFWLPLGDRHRFPAQLGHTVDELDDRVPQVVLVVALGEIVWPRMGAATLLPRHAGDDHALGEIEQEAELERLGQAVVEDVTLVVDDNSLVPLAHPADDGPLLVHLVLPPEDAEVLVHRLGELVADRPRPLSFAAVEQLLQLALGVGLDRTRNLDRRVRQRPV